MLNGSQQSWRLEGGGGEGNGAWVAHGQGRTQDFLKGGGAKSFPCIVTSRVLKINFT